MMTFLFWNSKHARGETIAALVAEHEVDVLMLAESGVDEAALLRRIRAVDGGRFSVDSLRGDVAIYTRFEGRCMLPEYDERRMSIRRILTSPEEILLVAVHLRSKDRASDADQAALAPGYANEIQRIENKRGHRRTLLVGDLNMNPFDHGVVQASGFHAVPSHRIATGRGRADQRGARTLDGRDYPFFYNPMWNCFGDERGGPPGTYYRDKGDPVAYFWHIYDQVLVRPSLVGRFQHADLQVLTKCGATSLLNARGEPDHESASDHLPIRFRLDLDPPGEQP